MTDKREQYIKGLETFRGLLDHLQIPQAHTDDPIPPQDALSILETVRSKAIMYLRLIGMDNTPYYKEISLPIFQREHKSIYVYTAILELHQAQSRLDSSVSAALIECQERDESDFRSEKTPSVQNNKIFIVHGHDTGLRDSVDAVVGKLGLDPVILGDQASRGMTIIEKLEAHSDVGFAIVLFSPDDEVVVFDKEGNETGRMRRPRQNVVLELGYFIGKLFRKNTVVLYKEHPEFEMLTDYSGVVYISVDDRGAWKNDLVKELKAAGFEVSLDMLG